MKSTYKVIVGGSLAVAALLSACTTTTKPIDHFKPEHLEELEVTYRLPLIGVWKNSGTDMEAFQETIRNMAQSEKPRRVADKIDTVQQYGPGHWIYEFNALGDQALVQAESTEAASNNSTEKFQQFNRAAQFYKLAAFPLIGSNHNPEAEMQIDAYQKALETYEQAGKFLPWKFEAINIPFEGGTVPVHLHSPNQSGPFPIVLLTNGIDAFMIEHQSIIEALIAEGVAVATFDLLGVGANTEWPLAHDGHRLHSKLLDHFASYPEIDQDRAAVFGFSFGGYHAVRLAFAEQKRLRAAVNTCGPIYEPFAQSLKSLKLKVPRMTLDSFLNRIGIHFDETQDNDGRILAFAKGMKADLSTQTSVPILSINTNSDPVASPADMRLVTRASKGGEMHIASGKGHCPSREESLPVIIPWLTSKLQ